VEALLVVLMAPLDRERVRRFAAVERVDQFAAAIDDADRSNRQDRSHGSSGRLGELDDAGPPFLR
jgi:hypothetical protein